MQRLSLLFVLAALLVAGLQLSVSSGGLKRPQYGGSIISPATRQEAHLPVPDTIDAAADAGSVHPFISRGRVVVVPGAHYAAGAVKRWFLGNYYRDAWTMRLEVPVIDLERTAGGLTAIDRGGGIQTATLHLVGADGRSYDLRSVDKRVAHTTPPQFQGTLIERLVQDQISSLNPMGALIVPPLARGAGILHPHPILVMIPDSPRLGPFREEFGGMLALFERDADDDQSDAARFAFSKNVIGSKKLFEKLEESENNRIDQRAYARARLFDMLIGDWDRHHGQWRWAELETPAGFRYLPVPTDRDFAFSKFDGFANRIARRLGGMTYRRLTDFGPAIPDVLALNWQALVLDRKLAPELSRADWVAIADSLKMALPDDLIEQAVRTWPEPVYDLIGPMTAHNLRSRRDLLPAVAERYYAVLGDSIRFPGAPLLREGEPPMPIFLEIPR